ncbi:TolC family protein [Perlabentimonas gracilis]|uniref:TolC family protein n=1 Tax=Perlabentimonas gracilis TaxID=2715279 RepID=UPI00140C3253|nr:TolC family protein [Perlabentimonas gracilis]NHB68908.1 TolC family protein [Perlabentimonas gracilis]
MKKGFLFTLCLTVVIPLVAQQTLSLNDCKRLALEHNYTIRIAKEDIGSSEAMASSARTKYFPNISATGLYNRTNRNIQLLENDMLIPVVPFSAINPETGEFDPNRDPANTFVFNPISGGLIYDKDGNPVFTNYAWLPKDQLQFGGKNLFMAGISITQPIYTGGKIREMHRISQLNNQIAKFSLTKEQNELLYGVEANYWRMVSLQEKVKTVESYIALLNKLKTDVQNLYTEGIVIKTDVLRVDVKANEAQLNLLKAQNGLELSRMALCQMVGLPFESNIMLSDSLDKTPSSIDAELLADSTNTTRPELAMLSQAVSIAQSGVNIMKSRYLPNVGLTAGYTFLNPNPYSGFSNSFGGDWNVGVAINIPIFHWNDRAHTLRAAQHEHKKAELQLAEAREMIDLQVRQAIFAANESYKRVSMAEENLLLATENLRITSNAFAEGMVKTTDVLEAQALWLEANSNLIDARMESQLSTVNLRKVTGQINIDEEIW